MATTPDDAGDDRFAELIRQEYGVNVDQPGLAEDAVHRAAKKAARRQRRTPPAAPTQWFSLDKAIAEAEPDYAPWDQFQAPTPAPLRRPRSPLAIAGVVALLVAVAVAIAWLVGITLPTWVRASGGLAVGVGLACLLLAIPRRRDRLGDGAVV